MTEKKAEFDWLDDTKAPSEDLQQAVTGELNREAKQLENYLHARRRRDLHLQAVIERLSEDWADRLGGAALPAEKQWKTWLFGNTPSEIEEAIYIAGIKVAGEPRRFGNEAKRFDNLVRYVSGILRNKREQRDT